MSYVRVEHMNFCFRCTALQTELERKKCPDLIDVAQLLRLSNRNQKVMYSTLTFYNGIYLWSNRKTIGNLGLEPKTEDK